MGYVIRSLGFFETHVVSMLFVFAFFMSYSLENERLEPKNPPIEEEHHHSKSRIWGFQNLQLVFGNVTVVASLQDYVVYLGTSDLSQRSHLGVATTTRLTMLVGKP